MRQDLMRGRPTEIDHMNGAVVALGPPGRHRLPGERRADGHHQGDGSLYDGVMTRVGIVAKSHLREATPHLIAIESWLAARGHDAVFETATAALMPRGGRPHGRRQAGAGRRRRSAGRARRRRHAAVGRRLRRRGRRRRADSRRQLRQPRIPDRSDAAGALPVARSGAERRGARRRRA